MKIELYGLILIVLSCAIPSAAQMASSAAPVRSHVERFSTPEVRAEKVEADATAKLKVNSQDDETLNARALARVRLNRYHEAYDDLREASKLKPGNADYQANLGYVLWKLGRANEAVEAERVALKLDDKNYTAHYQLGRFLLRVRGLLATDRDDLKNAINDFREALQRDRTLVGAWQDLGLAYVKLNLWSEAVDAFAELAKQRGDSVEAAYFYALALYNTQQNEAAEKEVRRALRLNPGAADAYTLLGIILASRGNANAEASEALAQAVALDSANFDAVFNLGRVRYVQKDYQGAIKSLREAVRMRPKFAEARFFLGTSLESAGDSAAALSEYQELIKLDPESAYGQVGAGVVLLKQGKKDEAISALRRAIAIDPRNFEAHWSLGRALMLSELYIEAVNVLQVAVKLDPQRADAHYQLGQGLRRLGRNEAAGREFAIVEKLNSEFRSNTSPQNP